MNIQIETITTTQGRMDVIRDIEAVRKLAAELESSQALLRHVWNQYLEFDKTPPHSSQDAPGRTLNGN